MCVKDGFLKLPFGWLGCIRVFVYHEDAVHDVVLESSLPSLEVLVCSWSSVRVIILAQIDNNRCSVFLLDLLVGVVP
jgi:hypothetical protein